MEELGYYHRRLEVPLKMVHICTCRIIIIITCTLIHGQYLHMYMYHTACALSEYVKYGRVKSGKYTWI